MTQDRRDVYTRITGEIIAAIEAGAGEFKMPWHHTGSSTARPTNITSGKNYRGVNVLALWVAAQENPPPMLLTSGVAAVLASARVACPAVKAFLPKPYPYGEMEEQIRAALPKRDV